MSAVWRRPDAPGRGDRSNEFVACLCLLGYSHGLVGFFRVTSLYLSLAESPLSQGDARSRARGIGYRGLMTDSGGVALGFFAVVESFVKVSANFEDLG